MRKLLPLLLLMLVSLTAFGAPRDDEYDEVMRRLDESLAGRQQMERAKERRIDSLRRKLLATPQSHARFQQSMQLYNEYKSFKYDSAHHYAIECMELARRLNRPDYEAQAKCAVAFCLLSSGLYKEAFDEMQSIKDAASLPADYRRQYYGMASRLYYDMADFNHDTRYQDDYIRQGSAFADSLLAMLEPQSADWLYINGIKQMKEYHYDECDYTFRQLLRKEGVGIREKAIVLSSLGWISIHHDEREQAKRYLAEAAICDNESATKETTALTMLAQLCYQDGDIDRATRYVQLSLEDANFYDARQRKIEIGQILPIIEQDRYNILKSQRNMMMAALVAAALAIIILAVGTGVIRRQMKKLRQARQTIEERNQELTDTNRQLQEANKIKDEYIGKTFYLNAEYINKVEKLYKTIDRKITTKQYDDLRASLKESTLNAERKSMFADFDETFLRLFPHFVQRFNELFDEKDRKQPDDDKSLTSEMRIFALIRLGVSDSERIANFLDYSVHTVNTYKTRIKNRSIVDNDLFERRIMDI